VSLFIDGQRATEPIQLPEEMKGKTWLGKGRQGTIIFRDAEVEMSI
jgi:hypothetical protein